VEGRVHASDLSLKKRGKNSTGGSALVVQDPVRGQPEGKGNLRENRLKSIAQGLAEDRSWEERGGKRKIRKRGKRGSRRPALLCQVKQKQRKTLIKRKIAAVEEKAMEHYPVLGRCKKIRSTKKDTN